MCVSLFCCSFVCYCVELLFLCHLLLACAWPRAFVCFNAGDGDDISFSRVIVMIIYAAVSWLFVAVILTPTLHWLCRRLLNTVNDKEVSLFTPCSDNGPLVDHLELFCVFLCSLCWVPISSSIFPYIVQYSFIVLNILYHTPNIIPFQSKCGVARG